MWERQHMISTSTDQSQAFSPLDIVLDALRGHGFDPQEKAGKWKALCPAHLDHNPSLAIKEADDGRVLVYCLSHQCAFRDIARAIGLEEKDFFPANGRYTPSRPKPPEFKDDDEFLDFLDGWTFYFPDGILCDVAAKRGVNVEPYGVANLCSPRSCKAIVVELVPGFKAQADATSENLVRNGVKDVFHWQIAMADWPFFRPALIRFAEPWVVNGDSIRRIVKPASGSDGKTKRQSDDDLLASYKPTAFGKVSDQLGGLTSLWKHWLYEATMSMLFSKPKIGKTRVYIQFLKILWEGLPWPDGTENPAPKVPRPWFSLTIAITWKSGMRCKKRAFPMRPRSVLTIPGIPRESR